MTTQRVEQTSRHRRGSVSVLAVVWLVILLVAPAYALSRIPWPVDWRLVAGASLMVSLITFVAYGSDKRRAEAGEWRIPETTLHLAELAGGWPGAFLAQRVFRHKVSKLPYQMAFWMIVLIYQLVALDSLAGWRFTKDLLRLGH
jgi:uncharacterized membrane protein YsdA (DUF1294 family)